MFKAIRTAPLASVLAPRPRPRGPLLIAVAAAAILASPAFAVPILYHDRASFEAEAGGALVVEDFESFPFLQNESLTFANGRMTPPAGRVVSLNPSLSFCSTGSCVRSSASGGERTFDAFPTGTVGVGMDMRFLWGGENLVIEILTTEASYELTGVAFELLDGVPNRASGMEVFFGVVDTAEILSLSFNNLGITIGELFARSNYSHDNVTTFAGSEDPTAVPEPGTLTLLGMALLGIMPLRRLSRRARSPMHAGDSAR